MNLLVTGGAGFIGSNFIRYWLHNYPKDQITNLDFLTYAGHLSSLRDIENQKNYRFVKGDITQPADVEKVMKDIDIIVHFAAESHNDRSNADPMTTVRTNVLGTHVLLETALKSNVKRFHHISTDEVFGHVPLDENWKFTEQTCYHPRSVYPSSKAGSDHLVNAYHIAFGLPTTITNCANNYGPYQDPEKFLPRFITNLIDDKPIPVYGDGKYVRDWLYVEDHCRAIDMVINKGNEGETYLVGGMTNDINNLQIAHTLVKMFHKDESYIEFVKDRPGHDRRYAIDWSKIEKELGWKPKYDFETWLEKTVDWYKQNEWWWRPLKNKAEKFYKTRSV